MPQTESAVPEPTACHYTSVTEIHSFLQSFSQIMQQLNEYPTLNRSS